MKRAKLISLTPAWTTSSWTLATSWRESSTTPKITIPGYASPLLSHAIDQHQARPLQHHRLERAGTSPTPSRALGLRHRPILQRHPLSQACRHLRRLVPPPQGDVPHQLQPADPRSREMAGMDGGALATPRPPPPPPLTASSSSGTSTWPRATSTPSRPTVPSSPPPSTPTTPSSSTEASTTARSSCGISARSPRPSKAATSAVTDTMPPSTRMSPPADAMR